MPAFVALLRAVNLPGHNKITMADLKKIAEGCGLSNARTLLASGNLVFECTMKDSGAVEALVERTLSKKLGIDTPVIVRSAAEWRAVVKANPFPAEAKQDPGHLLVMPLKDAPAPGRVEDLQKAIAGRERVKARGRELYLVYPDGVGRSKLTGALIDRKIGIAGTARNWNTALKLLAMFEE
jgi:uncharacterized protein (DUF1697 family)